MHTYIVINFVNQSHYHIIQSSSNSQDPNTGNCNIGSYCEFFLPFPDKICDFRIKAYKRDRGKRKREFPEASFLASTNKAQIYLENSFSYFNWFI